VQFGALSGTASLVFPIPDARGRQLWLACEEMLSLTAPRKLVC
jgi:hypothetical protein